jgi:hypothetical protein
MTPNRPPEWQRLLTAADVELYKGYRIEYQVREKTLGIVRVTANVTEESMPVGQPPQRFSAEARDQADARRPARTQATHWIDSLPRNR